MSLNETEQQQFIGPHQRTKELEPANNESEIDFVSTLMTKSTTSANTTKIPQSKSIAYLNMKFSRPSSPKDTTPTKKRTTLISSSGNISRDGLGIHTRIKSTTLPHVKLEESQDFDLCIYPYLGEPYPGASVISNIHGKEIEKLAFLDKPAQAEEENMMTPQFQGKGNSPDHRQLKTSQTMMNDDQAHKEKIRYGSLQRKSQTINQLSTKKPILKRGESSTGNSQPNSIKSLDKKKVKFSTKKTIFRYVPLK